MVVVVFLVVAVVVVVVDLGDCFVGIVIIFVTVFW